MNADELRADIERTREDLGETVEGLAAKADVKARALRAVDGGKQAVSAAPAKAAHTARTAVDKVGTVGQRKLIVGAASVAVMAAAVWGAVRGVRVRQARNRGLRRFWPR